MKIKEIMTSDVITVGEYMPVTEVAKIVSENKIHAVPVVDGENKVVGIITETDFFTKENASMIYMPSLIDFVKSGKIDSEDAENEDVSKILNAKARDIMSTKCENISPDMELSDFVKLIKEKSFNSYCVVDDANLLLGIMTVADAIKLL